MKEPKKCSGCEHCVCLGMGEYLCDATIPVTIMQDHMPNENYWYCRGLGYENKEEEKENGYVRDNT